MPNLKMNAIGIITSDMKRSLEFYGLLGLPVPDFNPEEDHMDCELGKGVKLMWDTTELAKEFLPGYSHGVGGSIGLAFECGSPAEVDSTYAQITGTGFEFMVAPWDAFWGQRYAIVKDPDGNAISLYAPLG
jgi:uncharacterized glyoxalase superfamily protein PhnB